MFSICITILFFIFTFYVFAYFLFINLNFLVLSVCIILFKRCKRVFIVMDLKFFLKRMLSWSIFLLRMPINITQWRIEVGNFNCSFVVKFPLKGNFQVYQYIREYLSCFFFIASILYTLCYFGLLLLPVIILNYSLLSSFVIVDLNLFVYYQILFFKLILKLMFILIRITVIYRVGISRFLARFFTNYIFLYQTCVMIPHTKHFLFIKWRY